MTPPRVRFPFTQDALDDAQRRLVEAFPTATSAFLNYGIASEIIINVLGPDWWATRLAGSQSDPFFRKDGEDGLDPFIHEARVHKLAADLLICQHFDGFAEQRDRFTKRSLGAVFHELHVARLLHKNGYRVRFVLESGVRGRDFDLLVNDELAVEAKAKDDTTTFSESALRNAISSDARRQLPPEGPGLLVLRIPDAWTFDRKFIAAADSIFRDAVRSASTRRINAIVVLWDEWLHGPDGAACLERFRVYENDNPRSDFRDLSRVVRSAAFDGSLQTEDLALVRGEWTVALAIRRHGGPGPLIESFDGGLQIAIERAGNIAFRVGGEHRRTALPITRIDGRWVRLLIRHGLGTTDVFLDDELVDSWTAPQADHAGIRLCPQVDADVREVVIYSRRLPDEEAAMVSRHLNKPAKRYVAFRRGDFARLRIE